MSYLVLARKYRPQTFADIIGQEHITKAICNALVRDRVPHALLFTGSRGVGKTSSARVIAKALNCVGRVIPSSEEIRNNPELLHQLEPCGTCSNCMEITKGVSLAVFEMDGASNNSVDDVRQLIDTLYTAPPPGVKYKIYIIDEVHMLSTAAFNALLKSLEEPPKNTVFIFATTEPHKIPDTVLSRCQQHDFRRIPVTTLVTQLKRIVAQEGFTIEESVLHLIAKRSDGGMRDATTLLDRVSASSIDEITFESVRKILGAFDVSHFVEIVGHLLRGESTDALELLSEAFSSSIDVRSYISDFIGYVRLCSLYAMAKRRGEKAIKKFLEVEEMSDVELEYVEKLTLEFSAELIAVLFDHSRQLVDVAVKSEYPRYVLEAGFIKLSQLSSLLSVPDVLERIKNLQAGSPPSIEDTAIGNSPFVEDKKKRLTPDASSVPADSRASNVEYVSKGNVSGDELRYNWGDFISYVKKFKDLRLDAYLRRIAPSSFYALPSQNRGVLELLVSAFELEAFKDQETMHLLKERLGSFSSVLAWDVNMVLHASKKDSQAQETSSSDSEPEKSPLEGKDALHIPGSHAAATEQKKQELLQKIKREAKEDELVKTVLDVFEGSSIEKVLPVRRNNQI